MMTKCTKEFSAEIPVTKKVKREDNAENKTSIGQLDLPLEILTEILENLSIDDLNQASLVCRKLNYNINGGPDGEDQHLPRLKGQFDPTLTPQLMTRKEYLSKLSKYRISAQHKEIEYIQHNWSDDNWCHISTDIKEKIKSITTSANTLEEFQAREQWLNDINERVIRSKIDTDKKELDLNFKKLTRFPAALLKDKSLAEYWQRLRLLYLEHNQLTQLPAEIGNLPVLEYLYLDHNQLTEVPAELGNLQGLQELILNNNQLTQLPAEIGNLPVLECLHLNNNKLTELPVELGNLRVLESLFLEHNKLTELPVELGNLRALRYLELDHNQLTEVPAELGNLWALEWLYLNNNQLTQLPAKIGNLVALQRLFLEYNQLTELPAELGDLPKLNLLSLSHNQLAGEQLALFRERMGERWFHETLNTQTLEQHRTLLRP